MMAAIPRQIRACDVTGLTPIFGCLLKGQEIYTKNGIKFVESIQVGDYVLTHKGRYRKVIKVMSRQYSGNVYSVYLSRSGKNNTNERVLKLTEEHPILIYDGFNYDWIPVKNIKFGRKSAKYNGINNYKSFVCFPKTKNSINEINVKSYLKNFEWIDGYPIKKYKTRQPAIWKNISSTIGLSSDFAYVLGLFVAEGSFGKNKKGKLSGLVRFSFNINEKQFANKVRNFLKSKFEIKSSVVERKDRNLLEVIFCCLPIAYLFENLCGRGAVNKKIPYEILCSADEIKKSFLEGLLDGDGKNHLIESNKSKQRSLKVVSKNLAWQTKQLIASVDGWVNALSYNYNGKESYFVPYSPYRKFNKFTEDSDFIHKPIKSITKEWMEVGVFNFEVEEDNSYVSDFVLHNCELYVNDKHHLKEHFSELSDEEKRQVRKCYHLLAIAYNNDGYKNLVKLTSWAFVNGFYYRPRVTHEQLRKYKDGIIFTSCCYNGEIGQAFERGGSDAACEKLEYYLEMLGRDNFYLELMLLDFNKQKPYDEWLIKAHDKYHIPLIVSGDCFVENTIVITDGGSKFIQDINTGDNVLTDKGDFKEVEFVNKRQLEEKEKIFKISTAMGTYAFCATGNHPVKLAKVSNVKWNIQRKKIDGFDWTKIENLQNGDYLVIPKVKKDLVFAVNSPNCIDLLDYLDGDFVRTNRGFIGNENFSNKLFYDELNECLVSYKGFDFNNKICIPRYLEVTSDLLSIFGLYLAEGGLDKKGTTVSFGLCVKEKFEKDLVLRYFSKFNFSIYETQNGNGVKLAFSSVVFRKFFEKFLGIGCLGKSLHNIIGRFSEKDILLILSQYFKGDGHFPSKENYPITIYSVSKKLIFDISYILNSLGLYALPCVDENKNTKHKNTNANVSNWNDCYYLSFAGKQKIKLKNILFNLNEDVKLNKTNRGKRYIEDKDCFAVKITDISKTNYDKLVYNLQVKDTETYTANLYSVHNCHYCNPEDSKYQRIMLMIQKKRTEKEILEAKTADPEGDFFELQDSNLWLKSEEELNQKWLSDYTNIIPKELFEQAKKNTVEVCRRVSVDVDRSVKLPYIPDADQKFKEACIRGFKWRGLQFKRDYEKRLSMEFEMICRKGFASYFMIQQDIIKEARRICPELIGFGDGDEAIGPGRGCLMPHIPVLIDKYKYIPIKDVKSGDKVLTRDGTFKIVNKVFEYDCNEEIINIKSFYGDNLGVSLTKEHLVLSEKGRRPNNYEKLAESTKRSIKSWLEPTGDLEWRHANEISVGDWVFIPNIELQNVVLEKIDFVTCLSEREEYSDDLVWTNLLNPLTNRIKTINKHKRYIDFDEEFAFVLGIFTGDGWLVQRNKDEVGFCFFEDDIENKTKVENWLFKNGFKFNTRKKYKNKKVKQLIVRSRCFRNLISKLYDNYLFTSQTKHVPNCIKMSSLEIKMSFLNGYFQADGSCDKNKASFSTSSFALSNEIRIMCLEQGIPCSVVPYQRLDKRSGKENVGWTLTVPPCNIFSGRDNVKYVYRKIKDGILVRVREVNKFDYNGKVYDLNVQDNHNFMTGSFLVHNSCCGSLVCYVLGITDVDPIKHGLLFDRFLSESRGGRSMKMRFKDIPMPE